MKINKIVLYNFNSFERVNEFDFSNTNEEKNIILIGGKNGAGKTSLFTAIKIALYGPLAFGYVGVNSHYIAKIKDFINSNTFHTNKVESSVQVTISLMVEREIKEYEIIREWHYSRQKLIEGYSVREDGKPLHNQELLYFQNYLQGLVPPELFEFFLFDGEEVGNIFSTNMYNAYVRNAVYTLCGLDTFEIVRKYTSRYVGKATTEDEVELYSEYERLRQLAENLETTKEAIDLELINKQAELEQIETELTDLETEFKNAGGITNSERRRLTRELDEAERLKMESVAKIRIFIEDLMPFFIVKEFTEKISEQLEYEEKGEIYNYIQEKLDRNEIQEVLPEKVPESSIDALMNMLLGKFKPKEYKENLVPMHDLSKEDTGRVNAMISTINSFDANTMIDTIKKKKKASDRTMEINRVLKSAMTDEDAAGFSERQNLLLKKKEEVKQKIYDNKVRQEELAVQIKEAVQQRERSWQNVKDNAQNRHVFELSTGLSTMMDTLLREKTIEIKRRLEQLIVDNLQHIYRKNNLITHIEIDDSFQFNLYQDAVYTSKELMHLLKNLGKDAFALTIGNQGQRILFERYEVETINQLRQVLSTDSTNTIILYKKIDLNRLSKGERQIFILSLYWAIIELSGQDIPFIIDTPYARIDANHRKEISEKFFPNISRQVIILSTDEEINEEYYKIIKPHIAKEYLLINEENQNRTSVENRYFFGV